MNGSDDIDIYVSEVWCKEENQLDTVVLMYKLHRND